MSWIDWTILISTLAFIILYGVWKSRGQKNIEGYLLGDQSLPWYHVMFSVLATQASAITFLSAPGQAYTDGMRFVQYYFGLPLAIIVVAEVFIPLFHRLKVFTAYEFLEQRFDAKTRSLTALLFLFQRGLAAGLTIYAPSLILSTLMGWNIYLTNLIMGGLVIFYTVAGGTKAVSYTQIQQMTIILTGMFLAGYMVVDLLPENVGFMDALTLAGDSGKMNVITTEFDINDKYNLWSGLIGGFFLALSYFGTDQSQVGRYLAGKSISQSRTGMLMNAVVKIPMQFFILLIGVLIFSFYHFNQPPLIFNESLIEQVKKSNGKEEFEQLQFEYDQTFLQKKEIAEKLIHAHQAENEAEIGQLKTELSSVQNKLNEEREEAKAIIKSSVPGSDTNDTNYIFLHFVITFLPVGLIGLLIAVIFSASWSSTASELNALASTTVIDFYKRFKKSEADEKHFLSASKWFTVAWGALSIMVAMFATQLGNSLIEAVNLLGSLFYGTILGIFMVAFFFKRIGGTAVFAGAIVAEIFVIFSHIAELTSFLWLNMIGCALVIFFSAFFEIFRKK